MMLLVYAVFAANGALAQITPIEPGAPGDVCVEGIVINWEEKPLAGWTITLTTELSPTFVMTTTSALEPDEDDDDPDFQKGEFEFANLDELGLGAGVYTATIESRPGWEGIAPETDPDTGVTAQTFVIDVGEDDCVRIRFKMRPIVPVTVVKIDANHVGLEDWKIKVVPGPGNLFASPDEEETDVNGRAFFTLTPGVWIFMEMPPKPDDDDPEEAWMPVVPPSGRQEIRIEEDDFDNPPIVVFKNELTVGCIVVHKVGLTGLLGGQVIGGDPTLGDPYNVGGWGFTLLRKDGSVARTGVTDAKGEVRFDGLPLGPYTLVEEDRPGWNEISDREVNINVDGNYCVDLDGNGFIDPEEGLIEFQNEQDDSGFCIEGYKIDANKDFGRTGIPDWEIEIDPVAEGGFTPDPDTVLTNAEGYYRFDFPMNDYRIPGAEYEICEEEKDGWLPHTPTCQTVRLPEWPGKCVQAKDFVNQQVGHSESQRHGGMQDGGGMDGSKGCSNFHVVKPGEGLFDIGRMYNKTPQQMYDANPDIKNSQHQWVIIGQKVCIP
jgi:hypothetical protein